LATTTSLHAQHYANEAARVVQDLYKSCRVPVILYLILVQEIYFIYFMNFYFILLQMGEPL